MLFSKGISEAFEWYAAVYARGWRSWTLLAGRVQIVTQDDAG